MKLPLPRRRLWRVAIYLVSFLLLTLAADMVLVEWRRTIRPGYETTRILQPALPDGSIDYLTAVEEHFSRGVMRENNAAPLILLALGRDALPTNQPPDGITDRLGMPHLTVKGEYFVAYDSFKTGGDDAPEPLSDTKTPPQWPIDFGKNAAAWVTANEKPLAILTEASKRPRYFIPFNGGTRLDTMAEILLPHAHYLREASQALMARAIIRLDAGDAAGFTDDMLTVMRLARLFGQAPTMVERMVANSMMEVPACRVIRLAIQNGKVAPQQTRTLLDQITQLGDLPPLAPDTINNGERYMILELLQSMSRGGPARAAELFRFFSSDNTGVAGLFRFVPVPYEQSMRQINRFYDGALAALSQPTYPEKAAALKLWTAEVGKLKLHNRPLAFVGADWPVALFLAAVTGPDSHWERARMELRLTRIALTLSIYRAEHHAYPETLNDLAPAYLAKIPADLFIEKLPAYARKGDGYILYSVGPNMTDDGGKSEGKADDIVASFIRP